MSRRRIGSNLVLTILLSLGLVMNVSAAASFEDTKKGIDATAKDKDVVIEISTEKDLAELAKSCVLDSASGGITVELMNDIVLSEEREVFIPTFGGAFKGNGHVITNLKLDISEAPIGFFRYLQAGATVEDLTIKGSVNGQGSGTDVGGICGVNYGTLKNCSFEGDIVGTENVGGIVGTNMSTGVIRECTYKGDLTGTHSSGGIAGNNLGAIRDCTNEGQININGTDVSIKMDDLTLENLHKINASGNVNSYTDAGGIAGLSSGEITGCVNNGPVGYEHVGYNIGGIVGRISQGFVGDCTNNGLIWGRKDVGGVAGQLEPFMEVEYMSDGIQQMVTQTDRMISKINATTDDVSKYGTQASELMEKISTTMSEAEKISGELTGKKEDLDTIKKDTQILKKDMELMEQYTSDLSKLLTDADAELSQDLKGINKQATSMQKLAQNISDNTSDYAGLSVEDISAEGIYTKDDRQGVIEGSYNYATVRADNALGGIVGRIATEYDADPEEDIAYNGNESIYAKATGRAVVSQCINYGSILAKKDYAGGVLGYGSSGAVLSCQSYGDVESASGNYVGGIAGEQKGTVKDCHVMCKASGATYVGGVVGLGMDVINNAAYVDIECSQQFFGAVAGMVEDEGILQGNRYVDTGKGAVNGISYRNGAEAMTYEAFATREDTPDAFGTFTIVFKAEDETVDTLKVNYGDSILAEDMPKVPEKEGYYGYWPETRYINVSGNMVIEAQYDRYNTVLAGNSHSESGKAQIMAVARFYPGARLVLSESDVVIDENVVDQLQDDELTQYLVSRAVGDEYINRKAGVEYTLRVIYPSDAQIARSQYITRYSGDLEIRVLNEESANLKVEVKEGETWTKVDTSVMGSYICFNMTAPGTFRVSESIDYSRIIILGSAGAALLLLIIMLLLHRRAKKTRKKIKQVKEKKARDKKAEERLEQVVKATEETVDPKTKAKFDELIKAANDEIQKGNK